MSWRKVGAQSPSSTPLGVPPSHLPAGRQARSERCRPGHPSGAGAARTVRGSELSGRLRLQYVLARCEGGPPRKIRSGQGLAPVMPYANWLPTLAYGITGTLLCYRRADGLKISDSESTLYGTFKGPAWPSTSAYIKNELIFNRFVTLND